MGPRGFETFTETDENVGVFFEEMRLDELKDKHVLVDAASLSGTAAGMTPGDGGTPVDFYAANLATLLRKLGGRKELTTSLLVWMLTQLRDAGAHVSEMMLLVPQTCLSVSQTPACLRQLLTSCGRHCP